MKLQNILQIKDLTYLSPNGENKILNKINYEVNEQDFIILLGSNGSGKSTFLKLIDGRLAAPKNAIFLHGKDILSFSAKELSQKIKILTQDCNDSLFPSLTLFENFILICGKKYRSEKQNREFLQEYLTKFNPKLASKLNEIVVGFSGGEKQTLALAFTIFHPPEILLLDEHTSALDPKTADLNMQLTQEIVKNNKITCLLTTHNLNIAERYGNRILAISHGDVIQKIESKEKALWTHEKLVTLF